MRIGKVVSINELKGTCRVSYFEDDTTSIELQIASNIYKMPKIDDLVLIAPLDGAKGIVVCTFYNDVNVPKQEGGIRLELNDNCYISFDKLGNITIKGTKVIIDTQLEINNNVIINSNLKVNGTIENNSVNLSTHTHTDSEGGTTSPPQ